MTSNLASETLFEDKERGVRLVIARPLGVVHFEIHSGGSVIALSPAQLFAIVSAFKTRPLLVTRVLAEMRKAGVL